MVANLPPKTILPMDEVYLHFGGGHRRIRRRKSRLQSGLAAPQNRPGPEGAPNRPVAVA
jgi:hypothetical protein